MEFNDPIENKVITAFLELCLEMPRERISVTAVCARAKVSRSAFYLHFSGVNSLMELVEYSVLRDIRTLFRDIGYIDLDRIVESGRPIPMFLRGFQYTAENRLAFRVLYTCEGNERFRARHSALVREYMRKISVGSLSGQDEEVVVSLCTGCLMNLSVDWLEGKIDASPEQMATYVTRAFYSLIEQWRRA